MRSLKISGKTKVDEIEVALCRTIEELKQYVNRDFVRYTAYYLLAKSYDGKENKTKYYFDGGSFLRKNMIVTVGDDNSAYAADLYIPYDEIKEVYEVTKTTVGNVVSERVIYVG